MKWYETYDNVVTLAEWLDMLCEFNETSDVIRFFEKPWKWDREWNLFQQWTTSIEDRNLIIERLEEGK